MTVKSFAAGTFDRQTVTVEGSKAPIEQQIQDYANWIMTFLSIIAVMYALYG